jgi:hypothetical protein
MVGAGFGMAAALAALALAALAAGAAAACVPAGSAAVPCVELAANGLVFDCRLSGPEGGTPVRRAQRCSAPAVALLL